MQWWFVYIGGPVTGLTAKSMEDCGWMISDWKKICQSLSDLIRKFDDVLFILFNRPLRLRRKGRSVKYYFFCR
jgi:hypothetical protein